MLHKANFHLYLFFTQVYQETKWSPPVVFFLYINIDGSSKSFGSRIGGGSEDTGYTTNNITELSAATEGLKMAQYLNLPNIILEMTLLLVLVPGLVTTMWPVNPIF